MLCVARGGLVRWAPHVPCKHQKCKQVEHAHHTEALASLHLLRYLLPSYLTLPSTLPSTFYLLSYLTKFRASPDHQV